MRTSKTLLASLSLLPCLNTCWAGTIDPILQGILNESAPNDRSRARRGLAGHRMPNRAAGMNSLRIS